MDVFLITSKGTGAARPLPFRPLSRSLGLLPSIALSRPTQVGSVSIEPLRGSTKKQRTATTPLTRCLTFGVHFSVTGATSGIGEAIATAFIEEGALLCDLSATNAALPFRGPRSPLAYVLRQRSTPSEEVFVLADREVVR